jgi:AcrR family transcriptional regulator
MDGGGPGPRSRERTLAAQRRRILEALAGLLEEAEGEWRAGGVTAARVSARAGVSSTTFYEIFENLGECVLALREQAMARMMGLTREAFAGEERWPEGIAAGLGALLGFLDAEPLLARVCLVDSFAVGAVVWRRRARELEALRGMLEAGEAGARGDAANARAGGARATRGSRAEASIESVAGVLRNRLLAGQAPPFAALLPGLLERLLGDYRVAPEEIGRALARAEAIVAERSHAGGPERLVAVPAWLENPNAFRMRECVLWVAEHEGACNGEVAVGLGITNPSHVSNLLRRLQTREVLAKRSGRPGRRNAWSLTPQGEKIARALRARE